MADFQLTQTGQQVQSILNKADELPASLGTAGQILAVNSNGDGLEWTNDLPYITTEPTAANTNGGIIIVVLSSEPATYYNGYYYIITSA